tara:strand:+ start:1340 stop:2362 length:1023 start_codon:yes stop_codon:yes gene_type:complete
MANNNAAHQPNDFGIAIKSETTLGSPIDDPTQLFTDSVSLPSFAPDQDLSAKSGKFVADFAEIYSSNKNTASEITATGLYNDTVGSLFEGILHTAQSSDVITVTDAYTAPNLFHGMSNAAATRTYTIKLISPTLTDNTGGSPTTSAGCIELAGCTVTALSVFADAGSDGGRLKYSVTFKTGYLPVFLHAPGTVTAPLTAGMITIHDLSYRKIAGVTAPVVSSFNLNVENPADYVGYDPNNNRPYTISRSVPEGPICTLSSTIKLDLDTKDLLGNFMNASAQTGLANHMSDRSDFDMAQVDNFAFDCDKAIITGMSLNEQAAMMYDVEQKLLFGTLKVSIT